MSNLLQVYYVVLPYVQFFYVLAVGKVPQRGNTIMGKRNSLQTFHLSHQSYIIDLLSPHVDVLDWANVIVFDFVFLLHHLASERFKSLILRLSVILVLRDGPHLVLSRCLLLRLVLWLVVLRLEMMVLLATWIGMVRVVMVTEGWAHYSLLPSW